jgi:type IV pilus secretin PilQ/predicted competence protein
VTVRRSSSWLLTLLLLLAFPGGARDGLAQGGQAPPQTSPAATPISPVVSDPWMNRLVTLDAEEAALPSVLKILAEKGDLNIITGPGVSAGRITIHMKNVPIEQAVNLVVRAAGLAYERIGNSILVADPKSLTEETGLSSYVVNLQFADATEVMAALKGLKAEITVDKGGNRLIVTTSPRIISEIQSIVTRLDVPSRQVMLEARIVEVSTDALKRLGIDWDQIMSKSTMFIEGNYDSIIGSGDLLDRKAMFPNTPGTSDIFKLKNFSREALFFNVRLDLLIRDGNARVLANPKLVTLNGREASMLVGSRIPYVISQTVFSGGGAAPTQSIQREEVGVKLRITPLINADGYITTTIAPEVSSVTGFTGENSDLPIVATRQASTTVRLKDGDSVIIGGLLSEERTTNVTKVPILGDIPGIGYFFQHQTIVSGKKDLVIEVTPRIMPGP